MGQAGVLTPSFLVREVSVPTHGIKCFECSQRWAPWISSLDEMCWGEAKIQSERRVLMTGGVQVRGRWGCRRGQVSWREGRRC